MSTGLECQFIEDPEGRWFYVLEDGSAPKNAWDWHDFASAYGPFASQDEAERHLSDNHANPGGWSVTSYREENGQRGWPPSEPLSTLLAQARR